jgi:predicted TIM-barrel enzyme
MNPAMAVRFVEKLADCDADLVGNEIVVLCPWLKGLTPDVGLWASALPIHDVNGFVDGDWRLDPQDERSQSAYVGLFALDRFRSPQRLLSQLRAKGVARIVNLPSVSFFDGRSTSILDSLALGHEQEVAFLRQAKLAGFRVALCARRNALGSMDDLNAFDMVLCHDGPRSTFTVWRSEASSG